MTKLTKEELKENLDAITHFIYIEHGDEWHKFCKENRNDKQDLEQLSTLVSSILQGYRVIIGKYELENMLVVFANMLADIKHKMDENEVDGDHMWNCMKTKRKRKK